MLMYRARLVRHGLVLRPSLPIRHVFHALSPSVSVRRIHNATGQHLPSRRGKLRNYFGIGLLFAIVPASIYWFLYPPRTSSIAVLDERRFKPFTIISKEKVSPSSFILTLRPGDQFESDPYTAFWTKGIWSVQFKQPQLQIARHYTPLPPSEGTIPGDLRFLIRKEHKGEVSTYLDRLRVGAIVEVRGPWVEWEIPDNVKEILFLAGGTGIAPALQAAHTLLRQRPSGSPLGKGCKITILWANRRRDECRGGATATRSSWLLPSSTTVTSTEAPNEIVSQLETLKREHEGRIKTEFLVDEEGTFIKEDTIRRIIDVSSESIPGDVSGQSGTKVILLSGPDGFVDFFAGAKEWRDGKQVQGPLGGVLAELHAQLQAGGWTVFKL